MKHTRLTLRARLTLVYGALFLVAGFVMLTLTWTLVKQQLLNGSSGSFVLGPAPVDLSDTGGQLAGSSLPSDAVDNYFLQVVDATRADALSSLLTQGIVAVVLVGGLAIWIGWLVAGRMLQPLAVITATARRIAEAPDADRRMHERIHLEGPRDEVTELADTFDGMLAQVATSFDAQRRFVANASHELRTPLTLNRALLEVAANRPNASEEVLLLSETLLKINARHERLIDGLLLLARSERELPERRFVDLADIVEHVVGDAATGGVAGGTGAAVDIRVELGEAPTSGDPVLLEHLVRNLVENAAQHNLAEGGWLLAQTRTGADGQAVFEVSNSGPVVPPYELGSIFEPFRRLDGERTANDRGVGLGLSIVQAIVQAHGGSIVVVPRPEGGLVVTVMLPGERYELAASE